MDFDATEKHTKVLEDYLFKQGADGTTTPTNELAPTEGVNPSGEDPGGDRPKGNIDAPWGEKTNPANKNDRNLHFSHEAYDQFIASRQEILDKMFDTKKPAQQNAQAVIGSVLAHGASGQYESRSPMLEHTSDLTLSDKVRNLK